MHTMLRSLFRMDILMLGPMMSINNARRWHGVEVDSQVIARLPLEAAVPFMIPTDHIFEYAVS